MLHLVTTHGLRHHGSSPLLQYLPGITTFTSDSSSPPLGLARKALEPFAFRPYNMESMFLVLVDAHSKWMDVVMMKNITTATTIERLRIIFATHGLPRKIVTDTFTSNQFKEFMSKNTYHPSTNGLAERAVQSFKLGIKRISGDSIQDCLSRYLFKYRITPHTTTGVPPAELLMGRRLQSRLDLELSQKVQSQQLKQKRGHDNTKT